jgi:cysteine-rich repeat protein
MKTFQSSPALSLHLSRFRALSTPLALSALLACSGDDIAATTGTSGETTESTTGTTGVTTSGTATTATTGMTSEGETETSSSSSETSSTTGDLTTTTTGDLTTTETGVISDTDTDTATDTNSGSDTDTNSGSDTDTNSSSDTDTDSDTDSDTNTDSDSDSDTDTDTGGGAVCGDGVVEGDEVCDDGNKNELDACLADCTAAQTLLVLTGAGESPGIFSRWTPGGGWSQSQIGAGLAEGALAATASGALAVLRRESPFPPDKNTMIFGAWSPGTPDSWSNFGPVGVFGVGVDGPGLATLSATAEMCFLGTDSRHYSAHRAGEAWGAFVGIPSVDLQVQASGGSAAALASGVSETYAVYVREDGRLMVSVKPTPGAVWEASTEAPATGLVTWLTPAASVEAKGDLVIVYVRAADATIRVMKKFSLDNAWSDEVTVANALTTSEVALLHADSGGYYLAWKGFDNQGVYAAYAPSFDAWQEPFAVEVPQTLTQPPALARGLWGAEAELLFVTGGTLRHARLNQAKVEALGAVPGAPGHSTRPAALRAQLVLP